MHVKATRKEELPSFLGYRNVCFLPTWQKNTSYVRPLNKPKARVILLLTFFFSFFSFVPPCVLWRGWWVRGRVQSSRENVVRLYRDTKRVVEHEKCGFSFPLQLLVSFVSFYLFSLSFYKLLLPCFSFFIFVIFYFEVEAHYGWEKNFGSISTEVASHTRIF